MRSAPLPKDEPRRLAALRSYGILDTDPEGSFDDLARLASLVCSAPLAKVSFVDADRQWFKARVGIEQTGTPRDVAFCAHTILHDDVFVVEDTHADERFVDNPLVTGEPHVRFYAGAPIVDADGHALGALCVVDHRPRQPTPVQLEALRALARQVMSQLELRRRVREEQELVAELSRVRERYDLVVQASREGIWDCDYVTNVTMSSPRACEIFDIEEGPHPTSKFDWLSRVHPDDVQRVQRTFEQHLSQKAAYDVEYRWKLRDGNWRWVHVRGLAVHDEHGRLLRLAGSVSDVSDRKRDELALRRVSQLLAESQRLAEVGGWELDLATNELSWTDETYRLHDTTPEDYQPRVETAIAFYTQDSAGTIRELVQRLVADGSPYSVELQLVTAKGRAIWVHTTGQRIDENGIPVRLLGTFQDITRRRRDAEELQCAKEAAEAANRAKSEFLATMSHEIRTPMNAVLGYSSLLLETDLDAKQREFLGVVERAGQTLQQLIDDVLDYAKIEAGRMDLEQIPFDVRVAVADVVRMLKPRANQKDLLFEADVASDVPAAMIGDPLRFGQVLLNLASNAVKFTSEGHVRIRARTDGGVLRVDVEDTGIGIDEHQLAVLFREFSQADTSTGRRFGGTGLGLAISRRLVEKMGGTIGVTSRPHHGSTFTFAIPLETTSTPTPNASAPEPAKPSQETFDADVLLVEDNPVNQQLALRFLQSLGCRVTLAQNGVEAVHSMGESSFDLVLMDCMMPEMDGFDATRVIRRNEAASDSRTPIVALTANAMPGDRQACLTAGMDDYLAKPFRRADLQRVLKDWVAR